MSALDLFLGGNSAGAVGALAATSRGVAGLLTEASNAPSKLAPLANALASATSSVADAVDGATSAVAESVGSMADAIGDAIDVAQGAAVAGAGALAAGVAATIAGLVTSAKVTSDWASEVDDLGDVLGTTGKEGAALGVLFGELGLNTNAVGTQLAYLARGLKDDKGELGATGQVLKQLGISAYKTNGEFKGSVALLSEVADVINDMPEGLDRTNLMIKLFGRSGKDLSDVMSALANGGFARAEKKATEFGLVLSDDTIQTTLEAGWAFNRLGLILKGVATQVGTALMPILSPALESLAKFAVTLSQAFNGLVTTFVGKLTPLFGRFQELIGKGNLSGAVAEFVDGLLRMSGVSKDLSSTIGNLLGNVAGTLSKVFDALLKGDGERALDELLKGLGVTFKTGIAPLIDIAGKWLGVALPILQRYAAQYGGMLVEWVKAQLPSWGAALASWASLAWSWIVNAIPPLLAGAGTLFNTLVAWVQAQAPGWGAALGAWVAQFTKWVSDSAPGWLVQAGVLFGTMLGWLAETAVALAPELIKLSVKFHEWVEKDVIPNILPALANLLGAVLLFLGGMYVGLKPSIDKLANQFWKWVETDVVPNIPGALESMSLALMRGLLRIALGSFGWAGDIGARIVEGIAQGLRDNIGKALDVVRGLVDDLLNEARRAGIIRSPSRLFAEKVGKPLAEGVALGFSNALDLSALARDVVAPRMSFAPSTASAQRVGATSQSVTINISASVTGEQDYNALARRIALEIQRAR